MKRPMKRKALASLLLAGLAFAPLTGMLASTVHAQTVTKPTQTIDLSIGRGEDIDQSEQL